MYVRENNLQYFFYVRVIDNLFPREMGAIRTARENNKFTDGASACFIETRPELKKGPWPLSLKSSGKITGKRFGGVVCLG